MSFEVPLSELELAGKAKAKDVISHTEVKIETVKSPAMNGNVLKATVPAHGIKVMTIEAKQRIAPTRYEAEWAYLPAYNDLGKRKLPVGFTKVKGSSGGICVSNVGGDMDNTLVWKHVWSEQGGTYKLRIRYVDAQRLTMKVMVNGKEAYALQTSQQAIAKNQIDFKEAAFEISLRPGDNEVKLYSPLTLIPAVDCLYVDKTVTGK